MEVKPSLSVIKLGGAVLDEPAQLKAFYGMVKQHSGTKIIIHGGGHKASLLQEQLGIIPQMVDGRRITDAATLEVVTMVYAGLLNKTLVAGLQAVGENALGLSGADANIIRAYKRPVETIDYGFAGDIDRIDVLQIQEFINNGHTPVFCAITHNGQGQLLNTNADTLAATVAIAMGSLYNVQLFYCFDKQGVLENIKDLDTLIQKMDNTTYTRLLDEGKIANGMLPKLHMAFDALQKGVLQVHLGTVKMLHTHPQKHTTLCL